MKLTQRIDCLDKLGEQLRQNDEKLQAVVHQTYLKNGWFTKENIYQAIDAIVEKFLQKPALEKWLAAYEITAEQPTKTVGLILAGNIPLVGFHDLICVFLAGHRSLIKVSEKDQYLIPYFIEIMQSFNPEVASYFEMSERLKDFDAVIATGSNNSARYFEAYFGKHPNIIRKNRNAVAVLDGSESPAQLAALGKDVFQYFGLGCRNVSKLYVPKGYDFHPLLTAFHEYREIVMHHKYKNNFDYGYTLLILNKIPYEANGCIMLFENSSLQSRIAQLHYEYYSDSDELKNMLKDKEDEIQCIVGNQEKDARYLAFGTAQNPGLADYADGVDTMKFLLSL